MSSVTLPRKIRNESWFLRRQGFADAGTTIEVVSSGEVQQVIDQAHLRNLMKTEKRGELEFWRSAQTILLSKTILLLKQ